MHSSLEKIENVLDYIEEHITEETDCSALAAMLNLSVYEFRRIFSFIVGYPISEYVRRRRLSLAACEIMSDDSADIIRIAEKYGYTSQSAFTKAFGEQHGISPGACARERGSINLFTPPRFTLNVAGRENVRIKIINSGEMSVYGYSAVSDMSDSCCCDCVWEGFYSSKTDALIKDFAADDRIYAAYINGEDGVHCAIGVSCASHVDTASHVTIPPTKYACFTLNTTDDDFVNEFYMKILCEWLPSGGLERREDMAIVEVFPFDMSEDGFEWEIWIPIKSFK